MLVIGEVKGNTTEYKCKCRGRDYEGNEVLNIPANLKIEVIRHRLPLVVSVNVECRYIAGSHGQRCRASHPNVNKIQGKEIICPYTFDLPFASEYLREHKQGRTLANKDLAKIAEESDSALNPWKHLFE